MARERSSARNAVHNFWVLKGKISRVDEDLHVLQVGRSGPTPGAGAEQGWAVAATGRSVVPAIQPGLATSADVEPEYTIADGPAASSVSGLTLGAGGRLGRTAASDSREPLSPGLVAMRPGREAMDKPVAPERLGLVSAADAEREHAPASGAVAPGQSAPSKARLERVLEADRERERIAASGDLVTLWWPEMAPSVDIER